MTTKLIGALLIAVVLFGGYNLFLYWETVKNEEFTQKKEAAASVGGHQLPGLPQSLESSLEKARQGGAQGLGAWLKAYGNHVKDPRKAWIELDYAMFLSRENPAEARTIYANVKARTSETSPVYKRVKELEKTYE